MLGPLHLHSSRDCNVLRRAHFKHPDGTYTVYFENPMWTKHADLVIKEKVITLADACSIIIPNL